MNKCGAIADTYHYKFIMRAVTTARKVRAVITAYNFKDVTPASKFKERSPPLVKSKWSQVLANT
jgi:hypothetical protein